MPEPIPIFRAETQQLDRYRLYALLGGLALGWLLFGGRGGGGRVRW